MLLIHAMILLLGIYLSAYVAYTLLLLISNLVLRDPEDAGGTPRSRFCILIPAHNEESFIRRILESFACQEYPSDLYRIVVVADNCTDGTAEIARRLGAEVLERTDRSARGKGHALGWAFRRIVLEDFDAMFVIDADSVVDPGVLKRLDGMLQAGDAVIQCYNGVGNPDDSWFTRLLDVSRTIGNEIVHPAKSKLGLSSYLMGNGMCFHEGIIRSHGWDAFTVGEDWEYYAKLIQCGERVAFAKAARVYHQESHTLRQATSQRMRWASGRFAIAGKYGLKMFLDGLAAGSIVKTDASLPLLFPNPSLSINLTLLGMIASWFYSVFTSRIGLFAWFLALAIVQTGIFLYGAMLTRDRMRNALSLVVAPMFLLWKLCIDVLSVVGVGRKKWVPTTRIRK